MASHRQPNVKYILYIYVNEGEELCSLYKDVAREHNKKLSRTLYPDAGFDLSSPKSYTLHNEDNVRKTFKLDYNIKCNMNKHICNISYDEQDDRVLLPLNSLPEACSYYLYPRSSIHKTNLRLANNVGIIDSGYTGNICACFDYNEHTIIGLRDRYVQICSPTLRPFYIVVKDNCDDINHTERGTGGFGSTGLNGTLFPSPTPMLRSVNNE